MSRRKAKLVRAIGECGVLQMSRKRGSVFKTRSKQRMCLYQVSVKQKETSRERRQYPTHPNLSA